MNVCVLIFFVFKIDGQTHRGFVVFLLRIVFSIVFLMLAARGEGLGRKRNERCDHSPRALLRSVKVGRAGAAATRAADAAEAVLGGAMSAAFVDAGGAYGCALVSVYVRRIFPL